MSSWALHCVAGAGIQRLLDLADARGALRWIAPEQLARLDQAPPRRKRIVSATPGRLSSSATCWASRRMISMP